MGTLCGYHGMLTQCRSPGACLCVKRLHFKIAQLQNWRVGLTKTYRITPPEVYVEKLGFGVEWEHRFEPHFPVFLSVVRDGMQLFLTEHAGDCQVGGLVHFLIPDVDAWYREFTDKGVAVSDPPNDDLGFRNMTVTDPDGNQLRFMVPAR